MSIEWVHADLPSRRRTRVLTIDGTRWTVREAAGPTPAAARTLIFECPTVVRRVTSYPDDWERLDDLALFALSFNR